MKLQKAQLGLFRMTKESLYEKIPFILKRPLSLLPKRFLFGKSYSEYLKLIKMTENFSDEEKLSYQTRKLREIAMEAYYQTNFWPEKFKKSNIKPENIELDDLKKFPVIDSETVKKNYNDMISKRYKNKGYWVTTGGTGRNPTPIFLSKDSFGIEWAFMIDQWKRIGFRWKDKKITFRGKNLGNKLVKPVYPYNELLVNVFKMNKSNIKSIVQQILKFDARFFHGFLSSIYIFSKYLEEEKINGEIFGLNGILLGSENIDEEKRQFLEHFYRTKTYSWYGHTEKGILAGECEYNRDYHVFFQYGVFNLLNEKGYYSDSGEIITTGFVNKAMPLINYKTGDFASKAEGKCVCGRNYTLLKKVVGRWGKDYVYDKNGNKISTTALNVHIDKQKDILNLQILQNKFGEIEVYFSLINNNNKEIIEKSLRKEFSTKLGDNFIVKTKWVEDAEIFRTETGKVPYLINNIKDF